MKKICRVVAISVFAFLIPASLSAGSGDGTNPFQWFDDAKLGMFIHWGVYSVPARGEWVMKKESISREDYAKIAEKFRPPAEFSPEEWVLLAKRMGAKYAVLTTRHHDGYALWNTKTTDFNSFRMCGRDFVREFADACRRHSLRVGFYYSILDWQYRPRPDGTYDPAVWKAYLDTLHGALRELMTDYGRVDMLWYDGCSLPTGSDPEAIDKALGIGAMNRMARELQPGIIINNRGLVGGDFLTPEQSLAAPPAGSRWESCMTVNRSWGYTAADKDWKSSETLIRALLHCTRLGGNLLLNIGPKPDGSVPEECVRRMEALGAYIRRCPEAVYGARRDAWTEAVHESGPVTKANGAYWLHALGGESRLDGVKTMKRAAEGIYRVEFRADARPANWLGGRHDLEVKAGSAPVLGDATGAYVPQEGAIEPCRTPEVPVPAAGEWNIRLGFVNEEGFKDTADFSVKAQSAKTVSLPVKGAKGYYARKVSPVWRVVDPRRWQVAGVFPGDFVGTGDYESIVKANDRDMLALARTAAFVPVGAANEKSRCPHERVNFSWSAPVRGFGYALAKTVIHAPSDGTYYAAAGFEYWGDVYVNGKRIMRDAKKRKAEPQFVHYKPVAFPIELKKGANDILIVNHGGSGAHFITFYLNFPNLPDASPDFGGLTFDFDAISERRFRIPLPGEKGNLVDPSGWKGDLSGFHVLPTEVPGDAPVRREIRKAMKWISGADGERAVVTDGERLKALAGDKYVRSSSGAWANDVKLPHRQGGLARLSFRFKMHHTHAELGYAFVCCKVWDERKKSYVTRSDLKIDNRSYAVWRLPNESSGWSVFSKDITIPPGAEVAEIKLRIDGGGELRFKDAGLVFAEDSPRDIAMQLVPHGFMDDTFALSSGQVGVMIPAWKRLSAKPLADSSLEFRFRFPEGVVYLAANYAEPKTLRRERLADGGETVRFSPKKNFPSGRKSFNSETRPMMLVRTDLPPHAEAVGDMQAFIGGKPVSDAVKIRYQVTPPVAAVRPKRYLPGVMTYRAVGLEFGEPELNELYGRFMAGNGVRYIQANVAPETVAAWRRGGIDLFFTDSQIANGYFMGHNWNGRPADEAFVALKGTEYRSHVSYVARSSCPLAIVEERPFFMEKTVGEIMTRELKHADGSAPNWEPFMFVERGCDCARCREAFAKYHRETGRDLRSFRSMMHGKVVKTLDHHTRRLTGGPASYGFIPSITWRAACSSWRTLDPASEYRPEDFASGLKAIGFWGPYAYWAAESPRVYQKRAQLAHYVVVKDIREQFDRDFPIAKGRPAIFGTAQGIQCYDWITTPEWIEMTLGAYLLNGWEGAKSYFFPDGYDARYWQAYARAATRAAKYEDFTLGGARNDAATVIEPVPEYAVPCRYVTAYLPGYRRVSLLQHAAWERDGARIVGVFNYWEKGEAFFTLKSSGLKDGTYVVVDDDGVLYAPDRSVGTYTAEELGKGIRLMVGAARMKVFEIRPASGAAICPSALMTAAAMEKTFSGRRPALAAAAAADAQYEAANADMKVDSKGEL